MSERKPIVQETPGAGGILAKLRRAVLPLAILAVGFGFFFYLRVEPKAIPLPPAKAEPIRTKVKELRLGDYQVRIRSNGVVRPHSEVTLTAEVPGRISQLHPGLEDGAFFAKDEVLLELDPVDYQTAQVAAEAQVARSQAAYSLEETRARQARLNWEDLGYKEEPNELVLRLPQLREAKANVDSAQAQLERAKRDLARTKIRAPFDGRVRRRTVGLGQVVGAGTALGSIFTTDYAEVRLPISAKELRFLKLPETTADKPVEVELRHATEPETSPVWKAHIVRSEGTLDGDSLDLFAIARVEDPFGRKSGAPPLRVGQPVIGTIAGDKLSKVVALPRAAVRQLDQILLIDRQTFQIKSHEIVPLWADEAHLVVRDPAIHDGAWVSVTHLVYAPEGAKVEIIPDIPAPTSAGTNVPPGGKPASP